MLNLQVITHPLISHKITLMREKETSSTTFRELAEEVVMLLAYESTKDVEVVPKPIETPVAPTIGVSLKSPQPLVVPIMRAGLGMLSGMMKLLPTAEVGFLGMKRDEESLENVTYANRLPEDVTGRHCFILDPMLATGGTIASATQYLYERGARQITAICLLAAPEGIEFLKKTLPQEIDILVIVPALDEGLNEKGYIVPGLGDAGDRLYGIID